MGIEKKSSFSKFYRVFVNATFPGGTKPVKAFNGIVGSLPTLTKKQAQSRAEDLENKIAENDKRACWVADAESEEPKVSLKPITGSASVYLAWTGTFVAAVVGVVIITVFSNSMNSPLGVGSLREPLVMAPPAAKSVHLTERQASYNFV